MVHPEISSSFKSAVFTAAVIAASSRAVETKWLHATAEIATKSVRTFNMVQLSKSARAVQRDLGAT
jgi:hypothetical protein